MLHAQGENDPERLAHKKSQTHGPGQPSEGLILLESSQLASRYELDSTGTPNNYRAFESNLQQIPRAEQ